MQVWGVGSRFEAASCLFFNNTARGDGSQQEATGSAGLVPTTSDTVTPISTSTSASPVATTDEAGAAGGAVSVTDGGFVEIISSEVLRNMARGRGGAMYCNGPDTNMTIDGVEFEGSNAVYNLTTLGSGNGGAASAVNGCTVSSFLSWSRWELVHSFSRRLVSEFSWVRGV